MDHQHWTAIVVLEEKTLISDHMASFSSDEAYNQISATLPTGSRLVALIPGKHAVNSFAFGTENRCADDWTRYVDPFEYSPSNRRNRQ